MNKIPPKHFRILALAPTTKGIGFAVLEGRDTLVNWGVKSIRGDSKNLKSLKKAEELLTHYRPDILVLEDVLIKGSRRSARMRKLFPQIIKLAKGRKVSMKLYSRDQVAKTFIAEGESTKYAVAEIIAERFSEQLISQLPPKRKPWDCEDANMSIFAAVALALVLRISKGKLLN